MEIPRTKTSSGARIAAVAPNSPAAKAGIQAGECVQSVNNTVLGDLLDWLWESAEDEISLELADERGRSRTLKLQRSSPAKNWGLSFEGIIFDGLRRCSNDCSFCFMKQLPAGMRKTLVARDDDYRLSFLQGNFITLTNVSDAELARIVERRLSPLYVSFHASDPELRFRLIGQQQQAALTRIDELTAAGIDLHIQIVLVPGVNDGKALDETLAWLGDERRRAHIASIGIVPVAHTDHCHQLQEARSQGTSKELAPAEKSAEAPLDFTDQTRAQAVIEQVQRHQFVEREATGQTWVHLADEFYIYAQAPFPLPEWYDGFPQLENGIGLVHNFVTDVREHLVEFKAAIHALPAAANAVTIVCGELARDTWIGTLSAVEAGGRVRLLPVRNEFFGGNVSVTGLLTAADIARALRYDYCADFAQERKMAADELPDKTQVQVPKGCRTGRPPHLYLAPDCVLNESRLTLDDVAADDLQATLAAESIDLRFYETSISGLTHVLRECAAELAQKKVKGSA